ncbi:MAG TPA: enolase C-terminal domain-like protein [Streptosporangiaceae bacterium]|jgi:mandelate racemase|nr:enolase C-terminal domain-like protein [Streptosporangiaceae bacterium]
MIGPGTELVVRDVVVRPVVVPFRRPLATKVGHFAQWPLLLIDITTEQGITGHGYLAPYLASAAAGLRTILHELGEGLRGQPAAPGQAFTRARGWFALAGYQGLALSAVAGLDIALWDVLAQAAGLPLARLLGGTLEPVPAYNSNGLGLIPPAAVADEALELLAEGGFTALKVRVGRDRAADDLEAVRRVRAAVGDEVTLVADYNQGLALGDALERCRALDAEGLTWIEEPLRYDDLDGHARLARDIATPVMLGENFYGPRAMHEAIAAQACDLVMPDLMRIGGVTGWLQAAAVADVAGLPMSSHLYPEVSGHLMQVTPTRHWLEWQDWADPVLARPFQVRNGTLLVPDVPGNGLEWDEEAVARHRSPG